ncbi:MAG: hypothetical protein AB7G75_22365 [Candidatus Binatia bacterium]
MNRLASSLSQSFVSILRLLFPLLFFFLFLGCTSPEREVSKALVKISDVTLTREDEHTLRVTMNYDLEPGIKLPLPYKAVLVFPLEPNGKLAGQVPPFEFSTGLIALDLEVSGAGLDWQALEGKDACCQVSLKGLKEESGASPTYERISNTVTIALPKLSD